MTLLSKANKYEAINLIVRDPRYSVYKCASGGRAYLLYLVRDDELEDALVERFTDISMYGFDGFVELFADNGALVLVFKESSLEETAADYLDESTSESQKLMFFERVLEAFCVHEVPPSVACDLLEYDNVGVTSEGSADCRYILRDVSAYEKRGMGSLAEIFTRKLQTALTPVGHTKRTSIINDFCRALKDDPPKTMTDFYDRYVCCVEMCGRTELGETKLQRLKKKALKAAGLGKTILTVIILGLACAVLVMSLVQNSSDGGAVFNQIGEVNIEENASKN